MGLSFAFVNLPGAGALYPRRLERIEHTDDNQRRSEYDGNPLAKVDVDALIHRSHFSVLNENLLGVFSASITGFSWAIRSRSRRDAACGTVSPSTFILWIVSRVVLLIQTDTCIFLTSSLLRQIFSQDFPVLPLGFSDNTGRKTAYQTCCSSVHQSTG